MSGAVAPRGVTRRHLGIAAVALLAATAAIVWNHRRSERAFLRDVSRALPLSVELSASLLGDWFALHGLPAPGVALRESALPHFNVAARDDRTQRTILVDPRGDRLALVLVSAPGGGERGNDAPGTSPADAGVAAWRAQLQRPRSFPSEGIGVGLRGQPVVRAHTPVPGTPYLLVRERDTGELLDRLRPALFISDGIFALVALLAVALGLLRTRAVALRAERDAIAMRSAVMANVSHELRTPLTQIRMYAEMLQLGYLRDDAERARALDVIAREAGRLGGLVDRALAAARQERHSRPATAATSVTSPASATAVAGLAEAAARATATLAPVLHERGVQVATTIDATLRGRIAPDALQQVLLNLLANAVKYGPDGQTIRMTGARHEGLVRVTVDDEGPGIPADERLRVWQPFVRGADAADASGSGIGLAIVRDLVVAAGGSVTITDAPAGTGARFVLDLPDAG